ncbi:hypothetical protein CNR37_00141 [Pseudomonas phage ventosus]|uniref:Uncharacterized protein n=1 Tax=Pseudomonas phage ventosus TaxID=2048980 RepID=A0A2H4P851_9CAUD|nr:hypothetical protein CNR37_00141 [Pseudomonas phage ventosus]
MTARTEPSVGVFAGIFSTKQSVKSHEVVLADALQAFSDATAKLDEAHAVIEAQVAEHVALAAEHTVKAEQADASLSRLARVRGRITDLLA